jgi:hypothetical protein
VALAPSAPPRPLPRPAFDKFGGGGSKGVRVGAGGWAREAEEGGLREDSDALFARAALLAAAVGVMGVGVGVAWALQRRGGAGGAAYTPPPQPAATLLPLRAAASAAAAQLPSFMASAAGGGRKQQGKDK